MLYSKYINTFDELIEAIFNKNFKIINQIYINGYFFCLSIIFIIYLKDQIEECIKNYGCFILY